jgi:uncharacterized protein YndB with AHSA1/START domain
MVKKIALGFVVALLLLFGYAATRPDSFQVQRSIVVQAPAEKLFPLITDFRSWPAWSPWERLDPNMKRTYSGAQSGRGAVYAWEGNDDAGKGRMEITEAIEFSKVVIDLQFFAPWEARNVAEFALSPSGTGTQVTWTMHGPSPFMAKLMGVFMDMDQLIGKDFEAGLANMKAAAER